ncbi:hypothetical protein MMC22_010116 [Lobaria immixta]|nr:hypothetical protein [Lobaria immixta]
MALTSRILELASTIQVHTTKLDSYITSQGLPSPSWDPDTPPVIVLSDTAQSSRNVLLETMEELKALILGPVQFLVDKATNAVRSSLLGLDAVVRFEIASKFPVNEEASCAIISPYPRLAG